MMNKKIILITILILCVVVFLLLLIPTPRDDFQVDYVVPELELIKINVSLVPLQLHSSYNINHTIDVYGNEGIEITLKNDTSQSIYVQLERVNNNYSKNISLAAFHAHKTYSKNLINISILGSQSTEKQIEIIHGTLKDIFNKLNLSMCLAPRPQSIYL